MLHDKIFLVDLDSGRYLENYIGHEIYNLVENNLDGNFYGYVPPSGNIDVRRIDSNARDIASDVLVVYVKAISEKDKDREIIAFCKGADVYRKPQFLENSSRDFEDNDGRKEKAQTVKFV